MTSYADGAITPPSQLRGSFPDASTRLQSYLSLLRAMRGDPATPALGSTVFAVEGSKHEFGANRLVEYESIRPSAERKSLTSPAANTARSGEGNTTLGLLADRLRCSGGIVPESARSDPQRYVVHRDPGVVMRLNEIRKQHRDRVNHSPFRSPHSVTIEGRIISPVKSPSRGELPDNIDSSAVDWQYVETLESRVESLEGQLLGSARAAEARSQSARALSLTLLGSSSLCVRVTLPFLVSGKERLQESIAKGWMNTPSFVTYLSDFDQDGDQLLTYIVHQSKIRFPSLMNQTSSSSLVLYCIDTESAGLIDHGERGYDGAILHAGQGIGLKRYRPIHRALLGGGGIASQVRKSLLSNRVATGGATAGTSSGISHPLMERESGEACSSLAGRLFDLELFVFHEWMVPKEDRVSQSLHSQVLPQRP